ncbi:MAG: coiled-coil domain-containing protein [Promethearchaeota archaeon]
MSEKKNTQVIIDETINAVDDISSKFDQITEVLQAAKEELLKLEQDKANLSAEMVKIAEDKKKLEGEKSTLEKQKEGLEIATRKLTEAKKELEQETIKLEKDKAERDEKIGALTEEQVRLLDEYEKLKVELQKFAKAAAEAEEAEFNFGKIKALLSIYTVLIEKIFQGQPHYRVLMTLHGDKEIMTREELKNATGIGGAFVLRAVQELDKVGLIEYDIDRGTAKLLKRLFPKKALED